jgi:hypothetical protein
VYRILGWTEQTLSMKLITIKVMVC